MKTEDLMNEDDDRELADADPQEVLDLIVEAVRGGHIAVMEAQMAADKSKVHVLVAAIPDPEDKATKIWPLAKLFQSDPFTELLPPEGTQLVDKRKSRLQ